ncbi:MAG: hypothetical protein ACTHMI_21345 [Mucilaginibacter sp.]
MNCIFSPKFLLLAGGMILICRINARCQSSNPSLRVTDTLLQVIKVALGGNPSKLFVHYDKNVYLPNETIWFTAYRLNDNSLQQPPDVLAVAIVKNSDHTIAAHKKFVVTGIASSGNMLVPDSVTAGDYTLMAYTNRFVNGRPDEVFIQRITIKRLDPLIQTKKPVTKQVIQLAGAEPEVKFYPEGGELVAGLPTIVGWEAKDKTGRALAVKALLYQDGQVADTITTSAYGMGKFFIKPKADSKYEVKIIGNPNSAPIPLPAIANHGVALTLPAAVVRDTLVLKIASTTGKIHIVVHNARKIFYALTNADPQAGKLYKIALDSLPRGLAEVTIYNQAMQPCAERVFFAHYNAAPEISIKPDQAIYGKRKKVTLTVNFNSVVSNRGIVSIACVRTNRIDRKNFTDIESFAYLEHSINSFAKDRKYIEDLLLIRGWRKYLIDDRLADTTTQFGGFVTVRGKPIKKPKMLVLFGDHKSKPLLTDATGKFKIPNGDLISLSEKRLTLMGAGYGTEDLKINWIDPYQKITQNIAHSLSSENINIPAKSNLTHEEPSILESKIILKTVSIKGSRDDEFDWHKPAHSNDCGDYVCEQNILNCTNHRNSTKNHLPVKGAIYYRPSGGTTVYEGCNVTNESTIHIEGISVKKEFYPYTDADITLSEPLYDNTLYWKNQVNIQNNKPVKISFFTGDIKAAFSVIVQGVADNEVVFGEQHFEVE